MYKTLMIVNLEAGRKTFEKKLSFVVMELKNQGFDVTIKYTEIENGADKIIENYKSGYDLLVVCGGDGTLNQTVSALTVLGKDVSVAYIPLGTVNDFGKTLNLPNNPIEIIKNIMNSKAVRTDTGMFNQHFFNHAVAFGELANAEMDSKSKELKGYLNLIKNIFLMPKSKSYKVKLIFDNETIEDEYIYGSISNSKRVGGVSYFNSNCVNLGDGKFEVLLIKRPKNILEALSILKSIILKDYSVDKNILFSQDKELDLLFEESVAWTIDGEKAGKYKNIKIGNINQNMEYLVM